LRVRHPAADTVIIEGTVFRSTVNKNRHLSSVKMRLLELGISYRVVGSRFESLTPNYDSNALSMATPGNR
jgi:hypothetical protein